MGKSKDSDGPEIAPPASPATSENYEHVAAFPVPSSKVDVTSFQVAIRQPIDLEKEGFKGPFYLHRRHKESDGSPQKGQLRIDKDGHFGRNYVVKSQFHTWHCSEDQFKQDFEKE